MKKLKITKKRRKGNIITKKRRTRNKKKKIKGGKAIGSGGFGCIFRPPLHCLNKKKETRNYNRVSKLMFKKNALDEYFEIINISKLLKHIKNKNDYFLLSGVSICRPNKFSDIDLINYNKCNNLIKHGITRYNINKYLHKLYLLQLQYGGKDLNNIFEKGKVKFNKFVKINKILVNLLKMGIIKMNKLGVYHFDIKASNLLYNNLDNKIRLIDWGLSEHQKKNEIPENIKRRPLQYNLQFSCILFNSFFDSWYFNKLHLYNNYNDIAYKLVIHLKEQERGHFDLMEDIINKFKSKKISKELKETYSELIEKYGGYKLTSDTSDKININSYSILVMINHYVKIFKKYTDLKNKNFMKKKFFNEVFSKNVDIWGFLVIYYRLIYSNNNQLKKYIKNILNKYLFSGKYAAKAINTNKLLIELNNINKLKFNENKSLFTKKSLTIIKKETKYINKLE